MSSACRFSKTSERKHAGFTLIELMISLVIGLLISLAMMTLLTNVTRNNTELSKMNQVIENGRFAMQLLADDLSHVGYWGGYLPKFDDMSYILDSATVSASAVKAALNVPTAVPDPCLDYASWTAAVKTNLLGIGVQGYEIPATVPATSPICAGRVVNPQPRTDVLIVRHVERTANCNPAVLNVPGQDDCPLPTEDELYLQTEWCGDDAPAVPYVLEKYAAASEAATFTLKRRDCITSAEKRKFVSNLYYIRNFAVNPGDGIPTLMRSEFGPVATVPQHQPAQAMVEGIEGFRVEFGIDSLSDKGTAVNFSQAIDWENTLNLNSPTNRGDGLPDGAYVHCTTPTSCTVDQLMNVVAVKIYVLVRSQERTKDYVDTKTYQLGTATLGPFNDAFKRHLFTQTVRLTNVSSRRETP